MGSVSVRRIRSASVQAPSVGAEEAAIRAAARHLATGVAVVTWDAGDLRAGLTATSVSLLSAEPATLLVALGRPPAANAFAQSGRFAVNVLGGDQREIAEQFAGFDHTTGEVRWLALADDLPCLADCAAVFECEAEETIERHGGAIVVARVRSALIGGGSGALVRWRGVYDQLGWSRDEISRAVGLAPGGEA
jgi:flavin reductase (DIM6/NTAB) family NADH-FMN oxidoreductase RutF